MENKSSYILPIGGLILGYLVLSRFGLIETGKSIKEAAAAEKLTLNQDISPQYIQDLKRAEMKRRGLTRARFTEERFNPNQVKKFATAIKRTKGGIRPDDEAGLYSLLRRVKYRTVLAQLDSYFFTNYGYDLPTFWSTYLNNSELSQVQNIISRMQPGLNFIA